MMTGVEKNVQQKAALSAERNFYFKAQDGNEAMTIKARSTQEALKEYQEKIKTNT